MELAWTPWAKARLLPVPGRDACKIDLSNVLTLGEMPFEELVETGVAQRVPERYNETGNHASDKHGDKIVDTCVATGGVELATKFLLEVCGRTSNGPYKLRQNAAPWGRLRQHLAAASPDAREAARALATSARTLDDERRQAVAFAFCDPTWVAQDLTAALDEGYGQLSLLASLTTPEQARGAMSWLLGRDSDAPPYQIIEEGVWFMPNLMRTLDQADAELVLDAAKLAWNKAVRKPWLEIVACLPGSAAKAYLREHGYEPADKPTSATKPAKKTAAKRTKKKPATKKSAKKPTKKVAAKKR